MAQKDVAAKDQTKIDLGLKYLISTCAKNGEKVVMIETQVTFASKEPGIYFKWILKAYQQNETKTHMMVNTTWLVAIVLSLK